MVDREWVSLYDRDDPRLRYLLDVSFLLSRYQCIYGAGCPGAQPAATPAIGCCALGAYFTDDADRARVEQAVDRVGPEHLQHHAIARRRGVTAPRQGRTRVVDGACIFLNRGDWPAGPGCALHQYALSRGEHPMTYKPEVCWMVPLRREVTEDTGDDGQPRWTTTITSFDRGGWGPGGADFPWWCTEEPDAYTAERPVYETMEHELRAMVGDGVYEELTGYLDAIRRRRGRRLPVIVTPGG